MAKSSSRSTKGNEQAFDAATRRSTSGAGFDFEDRVAAWLLVQELKGRTFPGIGVGRAVRLQMQTDSLGWRLDDILLTVDASGKERRLALSCKGNTQVSGNGLPADFMQRAWHDYAAPESPIKRGADVLALATRGGHPAFDPLWAAIKLAAKDDDAALALAQIRKTKKHRQVFERLAGAAGTGSLAPNGETLGLLRSIEVVPFDFHLTNSKDEEQAISLCRSALRSNSRADGERLWRELLRRAGETRVGTGTLDTAVLWWDLRRDFDLKDHPDFDADWSLLHALTTDCRARIEKGLPGGNVLPKQTERDACARSWSSSCTAIQASANRPLCGTRWMGLFKVRGRFGLTLPAWSRSVREVSRDRLASVTRRWPL